MDFVKYNQSSGNMYSSYGNSLCQVLHVLEACCLNLMCYLVITFSEILIYRMICNNWKQRSYAVIFYIYIDVCLKMVFKRWDVNNLKMNLNYLYVTNLIVTWVLDMCMCAYTHTHISAVNLLCSTFFSLLYT